MSVFERKRMKLGDLFSLYTQSSFFFPLLLSLGTFVNSEAPTTVTQLSIGQTIKGLSNSVWRVALPFRMEKGAAPGISGASITHCQDWRRLPCQNNNVDIHHKRPPPHNQINGRVCVCAPEIHLLPACPLWNKSSQVFISLVLRVSSTVLALLITAEPTACRHAPFHLLYMEPSTTPSSLPTAGMHCQNSKLLRSSTVAALLMYNSAL